MTTKIEHIFKVREGYILFSKNSIIHRFSRDTSKVWIISFTVSVESFAAQRNLDRLLRYTRLHYALNIVTVLNIEIYKAVTKIWITCD